VDRLGNQAQKVLLTHFQQSKRFSVMDRSVMDRSVMDRSVMTEIKQESALLKKPQTLIGADYVVTGDITEFDRK
jgi:curli biogenesis system outer membrane secretion channel CsgG